jgi:nucleoside-diphosphate-sugar epimerase
MKVLLIGAAGYIGRPLAELLHERTETVTADVRPGPEVDVPLDMRDPGEVYRLLMKEKPDVVAITAYLLSRATNAEPLRALQTNLLGLCNVFQAAHDVGVRRVVFASSGSIYGRSADFPQQPVGETAEIRPRILYAKMKQLNEWIADHYNENFGTEIVSYRISGPHGRGKSGGGQTPFDTVVAAISAGQKQMVLPWTPDAMFRFIHIQDAAASFLPVILSDSLEHRIYSAPGYAISISELAETAKSVAGLQCEYAEPGRTIEFLARIDSSRYESEFDFRPRPMAEWMREEVGEGATASA